MLSLGVKKPPGARSGNPGDPLVQTRCGYFDAYVKKAA
jgi:hypothetical protein